MKIYTQGDMAFVDINRNTFLCIGSKKEVDEANNAKLGQMVREAVAWSLYREIETKKSVIH